MIPVTPAAEPPTFHSTVRMPGHWDIAELIGQAPNPPRTSGTKRDKVADQESDIPVKFFKPYWTNALNDMMDEYGRICSYTCFYIHPVTGARSADHFAPKSVAWSEVYEWTNYRLCCSRVNSRKGQFVGIIDPFGVRDGWFELELVGFQVLVGSSVPTSRRKIVQTTIDRLNLNDFSQDRAEVYEHYRRRDISLAHMMKMQPFVAKEVRRQGRLLPEDQT